MLNERLQKLRDFTQARRFKQYRRNGNANRNVSCVCSRQRACSIRFKIRCEDEIPIVLPDERIAFMRTTERLTYLAGSTESPIQKFTRRVLSIPSRICNKLSHRFPSIRLPRKNKIEIGNLTVDHALILREGIGGRLRIARERFDRTRDGAEREFLECAIETLDALQNLIARYASEAERVGNIEMAGVLRNIQSKPPANFHEALQLLRIVQFGLYLYGMYHCGLGRMDQYLYPFYKSDVDSGRLTREGAAELLAEFFISLNRDADLYPGGQQGDNGQSVMLGGCDPKTGCSAINPLTYLIIEVSRDVRLIDPKINLRIDRNTPLDLLELGSSLTRCGLGFPQYSNDDVVIPALVRKGYSLEDARDYTVAACWEYVIPGRAMDVVNQGAVSFPYAVDWALRKCVRYGRFTQEEFAASIKKNIRKQIHDICKYEEIQMQPSPFISCFFKGTLESGIDITKLSPYHKIGIHGAGSANAADAMAAITAIFKSDGIDGLRTLVKAQDANFVAYETLREHLVNDMPKVGNDNPEADDNLKNLYDWFADAAEDTRYGNRIRPGTGSAMFYIWLTDQKRSGIMVEPVVGATSDGRLLNAPLASSLAPAHEVKVNGVFSVFKSFAKIDYSRIMNGGPVTIELSKSVFNSSEGERKLGQLIQYFVKLGGQQLQLNLLDVAELEDAVKHPELHRNLIVRVWGWSGYFCELAPEFQQQIIRRHRYGA